MAEEEQQPKQEEQKEEMIPFYTRPLFWGILIVLWISCIVTLGVLAGNKVMGWTAFWLVMLIPLGIGIVIGIILLIIRLSRPAEQKDSIQELTRGAKRRCRKKLEELLMDNGVEIYDYKNMEQEEVSPEGEEGSSKVIYSAVIKDDTERFYWMVAMTIDNLDINVILKSKSGNLVHNDLSRFEKAKRKLAKAFREPIRTIERTSENTLTGIKSREVIQEPTSPVIEQPTDEESPLGA